MLDARAAIDESRWLDVAYEELVSDPLEELRRIYGVLGLRFGAKAERFASELRENVAPTSLTVPRPEKWRDENAEAIERILPLVAETERRLGYRAA